MNLKKRNRLRQGQVLTGILGVDPTPPGGLMPARTGNTENKTNSARNPSTDNTPVVNQIPWSLWEQMIDSVDQEFFRSQRAPVSDSHTPRLTNVNQTRQPATLGESTWVVKPGRHGT